MTTDTTNLEIPAILKRETNAKGVTLSAGIEQAVVTDEPAPITATGAKTTKKSKFTGERKASKKIKKVAPVEQPAEAPVEPEAASTPVTANPALVVEDGEVKPIEKVSRSIVPMRFKAKYAKHGGTCGDDMALELKAATTTRDADKREVLDVEALWAIAKANEIDVEKYLLLNNGQKRMNVGNKLRSKLNQGGDVTIGARTFKAEDWTPRH